MTLSEHNVESFVDALRADVPTARDELRVRARLAAAGVAVGASVAAPSLAVAHTGLGSKLAALSWTAKVGLATAVVAAGTAAPVVVHYARTSAPNVPSAAATRAESRRVSFRTARPADAEGLPRVVAEVKSPPSTAVPTAQTTRARSAEANSTPTAGSAASALEPAGAFPAVPFHGTLREETELMERALAAIREGDRATAFSVLKDHARRFPNGLLARERERALGRLGTTTNVDR